MLTQTLLPFLPQTTLTDRAHFTTSHTTPTLSPLPDIFSNLTPNEARRANAQRNTLGSHPDDDICYAITARDLYRLRKDAWLNAAILDGYFQRIEYHHNQLQPQTPCHFFPCLMYSTLMTFLPLQQDHVNWLLRDGLDPLTYSNIFFPINFNNVHWALIHCSLSQKTIHYYNSLPVTQWPDPLPLITAFLRFVQHRYPRHQVDFSTFHIATPLCPQQSNGSDCGVFTITIADCILRQLSLTRITPNSMDPSLH